MKTEDENRLQILLRDTVYCVEATDFEALSLWVEHHEKIEWRQENPGYGITVGQCAKMPVTICLTWNWLNGHLIVFYEATSQVVDHRMVEKWLKENLPVFDQGKQCNAMNFGHCLQAIRA